MREPMTAPRTDSAGSKRAGRLRITWSHVVLAGAVLALAAVLVGCSGEESAGEDGTTVSGIVVDVRGGLTELEQFDLVLEDGTRLTFVPEAGVLERSGFSPAHIREHSALVEPISVTYQEVDGQNIVLGVGDEE
jgi:hypothetical protein